MLLNLLLLFDLLTSWSPCVTCSAVTLSAAGASFPAKVYDNWIKAYEQERKSVSITYKVTGSGEGKRRIVNNTQNLDFVGSDTLLSEEQKQSKQDLITFPMLVG